MSKFKATVLIIIFFLLGVLVDRSFLYYEIGEKNKLLLEEQQSIKADYEYLIQKFEKVEEELKFRMMMDSIMNDSIPVDDSMIIKD
jgi:hypothetical protein